MIENFAKSILKKILWLLSFIIDIKIIKIIEDIYNKIINYSIMRKLNSCSKNTKFTYPIDIMGYEYINIGENVNIYSNLRIEAISEYEGVKYTPNITIMDGVCIGQYCHIGCIEEVYINKNVLIASKVFITDHFHGQISKNDLMKIPKNRKLSSKGKVFIDENVWIGENVVILPGVTIGKNSIVGANSVVSKNIPANCVVAGAPAKIIKYL